MRLTEEQIEHYFREGYVLAPGLVPPESARAVMEAAPQEVNHTGRWQARVFDHADPDKDARIHRLLVEPGVVEAVTDIFATPPRVYYGMLAIVEAGGGHGLPWHQDNQYTLLLGGALNVFIALRDIAPNQANLWVAPRSHHHGVLPAKAADASTAPGHREAVTEPENGIPLPPLQAGDACIFDRCTLHRSRQNETGEHRYAYAAQYQAENARPALTGKKDPLRIRASELRQRWRARDLI